MELNNINNKGAWSEIAAALNQNFLKILAELLKYQHVTTISGANFLGYFTSSSVLPNPEEAAWAVAGDLKAVTVYAYYTSDAVPSGFSAGWNALSSLGTYDFTDYSNLLTKVEETDAKVSDLGSKVWYFDIDDEKYNINDAIVFLSINKEYNNNWTLQSFDTESYPKSLIFWENKESGSYIRHQFLSEDAIIRGDVYEWKTSSVHLIVDFSKTEIKFGYSVKTGFCVNPVAFDFYDYNSIFSIRGISTYRNGSLIFNQNFIATPYIEINRLKDNDVINCYFNASVGIQAYDEKYNYIGEYPNSKSEAGDLIIDKNLFPSGSVYFRCCRYIPNTDSRVGNITYVNYDDVASLGYIIPSNESYKTLAKAFTFVKVDDTLQEFDEVCIGRIPSLAQVKNGEGSFNLRFWKNGELVKGYAVRTSVGEFYDNIFEYNDGYVQIVVDYGLLGNLNEVAMNTYEASSNLRLSKKCFNNNIMPYVITQSSTLLTITKVFKNFKVKRNYSDITIQRVPATVDALAENSTEYFVFYVWEGDSVVEKIYKYISDGEVLDGVISFKGTDFDFEVDYNVTGEIERKASSSRQDLNLSKRCFFGIDDISAYERPDLVGKEYANISSSTFSSYGWHKRCVENLGMIYSNFGMGGGSHRCYTSTKFNLNYQDTGEPSTDRVILNMVAKMCTEAVVNGYYPNVIASCCVLNDCYKSIIPEGSDVKDKIGTAEEALSIVMPDFDLSSEESIVTSFTNFFESEDDTIKYYRGNSTICNRIALELLSRAFPKACIVVCSCQQVTSDSFNKEAIKFFNEQQKKLCQYYAIPYIDINGECGINSVTASIFLKDDLLHPNSNGELVYTNYYTRQINSRLFLKNYPSN